MVYDGHGPAFGRCDLVGAPFKIDGVVIVDSSRGSQREVKIEKGRGRAGPQGAAIFQKSLPPNSDRHEIGGSAFGLVLAGEFHLKDFVSMEPIAHFGMGHKSNQAALESAEATFDFSFGLRTWGNEMSDAQGSQGALELAPWIGVVIAGTGTKKTQAVGIDGLRYPVIFEGGAEVGEVVPRCVGSNETPGDVEAGMVVNAEEENLLGWSGPPLVDRAVMLPEIADLGAAETPVGARFSFRSGNEMREMSFDESFNTGTSAGEATEAQQFVADELVIGRILERQKAFQKSKNLRRPGAEMVPATGAGLEAMSPAQPRTAELVETGFADPQGMGSLVGIQVTGVEI